MKIRFAHPFGAKKRLGVFAAVIAAVAGIGLLGATGSAQAQTIYGPGGLLLNPTADFPKKGSITPSVLAMPQRKETGPGYLTWTSYNVDYAASDDLELGATYLKVSPGSPAMFQDGSAGLYAKYRAFKSRPGTPVDVAVGASFLSGGDANASTAFVAGKYALTRPGAKHGANLHLGAIYVNELDCIKHHRTVPYAGVDYGLTPSLRLFGEARAALGRVNEDGMGSHPQRAVGLIYQPDDKLKLVVGYAHNGWNDKAPQFSIGIGYGLGGGR